MTTIINTPPQNESTGGVGIILGLVGILVVAYLFISYGIPAMRQMQFGSPQITVPSEIDVNINQPK